MVRVNSVLLAIVRVTGWPLMALMVLYLLTGYALCGQHGLGGLMGVQQALAIHRFFAIPLVAVFLAHSLPSIYLAFWRWGWIGKRRKA